MGSRDTTQLHIRDETRAVILRATGKRSTCFPQGTTTPTKTPKSSIVASTTTYNPFSSTSAGTIEPSVYDLDLEFEFRSVGSIDTFGTSLEMPPIEVGLPYSVKPKRDDIATSYFLRQFTLAEPAHWNFSPQYATQWEIYPCLDLAMRACGMAALDNVENIEMGREGARSAEYCAE